MNSDRLVFAEQRTKFDEACLHLKEARAIFKELAELKPPIVGGNDNHIGDIGEFWAAFYYESHGEEPILSGGRTTHFDLEIKKSGKKVSVKTLSPWSVHQKGTPVKGFDKEYWNELFAIILDENLLPSKMAIIPGEELKKQSIFIENVKRRNPADGSPPTKTYPIFRWWPFLDQYIVR